MSDKNELTPHKIYLVAGEASGDLHGSNLMKELSAINPNISYRVWGGDLMQKAGGELISHYKDRAVMGIVEVLKSLKKFKKWVQDCKDDLINNRPDLLILIDYGGFNLRIAEFAKKQGIPVHYYIPPKVWAWNERRVKKIKKFVDHAYVILPFEEKYFHSKGVNVQYFGNPLADEIEQFKKDHSVESRNSSIALLPGSRKQEINYGLPIMLKYASQHQEHQFKLAAADSVLDLINTYSIPTNVEVVLNKTYEILSSSKAAIVTSGTANLEAALLDIPQVVVYRGSFITFVLAQLFIKVKYLSPVNLIAEKEVVKELIQYQFNPRKLNSEINKIYDGPHREMVLAANKKIREIIGTSGSSKRVAKAIYAHLK